MRIVIRKQQVARQTGSRFYRYIAAFSLVNYLAICCGLPLPAVQLGGKDSKPFPCQGHNCGCRSAEQCWKSCCCMNPQQKLAWAAKHHVTAPDSVVADARAASETPAKSAPRSCCAKKKTLVATSCGQSSACKEKVVPVTVANKTKFTCDWVFYIEAQRCRGGSAGEWLNVPVSIPVVPNQYNFLNGEMVGTVKLLTIISPLAPCLPPPDPPPRLV